MPKVKSKAKVIPGKGKKQIPVVDILHNDVDMGARVEKFIEFYWQWNKAKQAAIAAGVPEAHAQAWAHHTLALPAVQLALSRKRAALVKSSDWSADDSIRELIGVAMVDPIAAMASLSEALRSPPPAPDAAGVVVLPPGRITLDDIPTEVRRCIKKLKMGVAGLGPDRLVYVDSIEFYSRIDAIKELNLHIGFYKKDNEQKADAMGLFLSAMQKKHEGGDLVARE